MSVPKACIIGHPVKHSRSPLIHHYWLRTLGIEGDYERLDVPPEIFKPFVQTMRDRGLRGGNVTVPHKERLVALADELTDAARNVGAANTIWFEDGKLCADSTDGAGFLDHLDEAAPGWDSLDGHAIVIGAGGAARCIAFALASRSVPDIVIVNRSAERAEILARNVGRKARGCEWRNLPDAVRGASLLVNATSLGMEGQPRLDCPLQGLRRDAVVNDIVYAPLETDLLDDARRRGLRAVDGLGMLLHQAVPGFARWFGATPKVTPELRTLIVADLVASH